jgi:glycosyltransferase involved in cell wall biosynthesis
VLQHADRVIVFSETQRTFVHKKYKVHERRLRIIPNGIAKESVPMSTHETLHNPMRLLYVGRLTVQKRVERIIECLPTLPFPAVLTIVGDGEDRKKLEAIAKEKCPNAVTFEGAKTIEETRMYFKDADVFVMASDKEGMPIAMIEAMMAGLPIVGSDVLGIRELIDGVGLLVHEPNAESFAKALTQLHDDPKLVTQLRRLSREKAEAHTITAVGEAVDALYKEL